MKLSDIGVEVLPDYVKKESVSWGVRWPVTFKLQKAAPENGWVIQRIHVRYRTWITTDGKAVFHENMLRLIDDILVNRPEERYWEAWPVKEGECVVRKAMQDGSASPSVPSYPDEYLISPNPEKGEKQATGEIVVLGLVAFYLGELPALPAWPMDGTGGILRQTQERPEFWDDTVGTPHHLAVNLNKGVSKRIGTMPPVPETNRIEWVKPPDWPTWASAS